MSSFNVTLGCHHDAGQSQLVRGLYIVMVWWHYISNIFVKLWFLTFQLWMSTEIWNFHYYLMKSIIILVLTMDNWHFVRRAQFNYVWVFIWQRRVVVVVTMHGLTSPPPFHLSAAATEIISPPDWPPFILSGFSRHWEAPGGSDLMLEKL